MRYGMTIPFGGVPLHEQREWIEELLERAGFTVLTALLLWWLPSRVQPVAVAS